MTPDNEMFTFGGDYGTGGEDDHFHLGFSNKKLLERLRIF